MEAVDLLPKGANSRIAAAAVGLVVAIMRNWTREKSGSIVLMNRFTRARARGPGGRQSWFRWGLGE